MKNIFILIFIFSTCIYSNSIFSQNNIEQNNPFIQNYNNKEYKTPENQTWAIVQDHRGVMYFGNNNGVLEFDGNSWRLIEITNKSAVRSLAIDSAGRVFVGAVGEFGFLQADSTGSMQYVSLLEKIPGEERDFMDVWEIFIINKSVIVKTSSKIFLIKNNKPKVFKSKNGFHVSFLVNTNFFVKEREKGLLKLVDDSLQFIPGSELFVNDPLHIMLPYEEDKILIVTRERGIFIYNPIKKNVKFSKPAGFNEADNFLIKNQVYYGAKLNNEQFILGTSQNGLIIIDKSGNILQHFNKDVGLQDIKVLSIYVDSQKNIWAGLNKGVSYIIMNSPLTLYSEKDGLFGSVYTATIYKSRLYAASSVGLFYKDTHNKFKVIENTKGQGWYLTEINDELFFGHAEGVFIIKDNVAKKIVTNVNTIWNLKELKNMSALPYRQPAGLAGQAGNMQDKPYILAGHNTGLILLEFKNGNWVLKHKIKGFDKSAHIVQEDYNGDIWISHRFNEVCRLRLNQTLDSVIELNYYNSNNSLPQNNYNFVFKIKTANQPARILFGTEKGIYNFDPKTNRFAPDKTFNKLFDEEKLIDKFVQDANGNIYYQHGGEKGILLFQTDSTYILEKTPFLKFKGLYVENLCVIDTNNVFYCSEKGLIYYNPRIKADYNNAYPVLIRQVLVNDSLVFGGARNTESIIKFPYKQNSIRFSYSALYYEEHDKTQYSIYLEGFDKKWSEWSLKTEKEYTNLPEGNYIFHVKAKNIYEKESSIVQYQFEILTPWYRTIIAYIIYSISTLFLVWLIVLFYTRKLKKEKDELEKIVIERTKDLHDVNTQLEEKQADLEIKQDEIEAQAEHLACVNKELEKLSIVASRTDNAVMITDAQGNFEWVNEGFTRMYGYTLHQLITTKGKNIINTSANPQINVILNDLKTNKETVSYETLYTALNGNKVWAQTTITPLLDEGRNIIKLIAIDSDITDLKKAEEEIIHKSNEIFAQKEEILTQKEELEKHRFYLEELVTERTADLEKAKIRAEESDRLKSSFLANMSHEIRTPLNAIIGFTNLLMDADIGSDQKDELSKLVIRNSDSLLRLIDDIIDIAKLESGQFIIENKTFDLINLLGKVFETYNENKKIIDKKHIELIFNKISNNDTVNIYSDPLRIQQIITNLLNNAFKYTEKGFVKFGFEIETKLSSPLITFYVKDTGIGISPQQQEIIFSRFTKIEDNRKKLYRGAGLGLAISKSITELLGGKIWVESEPNQGSTFYFSIPYIPSDNNDTNYTKRIVHIQQNYNWPGKTILIAEDEENNYRYFEMILSKTQANILHAKNGIEVIEICKNTKIDLVLMDIKMPEMDGLEATKQIREFQKELPIIALTAFAMGNDEKMSLKAGCNAYIAKPVSKTNLFLALNKFLTAY